MRIILAGLPKDDNMGDPLLFECCKRLYKESLRSKSVEAQFYECNLRPQANHILYLASRYSFSFVRHFRKYLPRFIIKTLLLIGVYAHKRQYNRLFQDSKPELLIFVGGG